jgi:hypothetical protein
LSVLGEELNLVKEFVPKQRYWWEGNGLKVRDAKLYLHHYEPSPMAKGIPQLIPDNLPA